MYYATLNGLSSTQVKALFDIEPEEIGNLDINRRLELAIQYAEHETRRKEAFWHAVQAFAAGVIPILALFGITRLRSK